MTLSTKATLIRQQGFTVLEVIVALTVMVTLIGLAAIFFNRYNDSLINKQVAEQLEQLGDAATAYVQDNYQTLTEKVKSEYDGGGRTFDPQVLTFILSDPLPLEGLRSYSSINVAKNILGQDYTIFIIATVKIDKKSTVNVLKIAPVIYADKSDQIKQMDFVRFSKKIAQQLGVGGVYVGAEKRDKGGFYTIYYGGDGQKININNNPILADLVLHHKSGNIGDIIYFPAVHNQIESTTHKSSDSDDVLYRKKIEDHPEKNKMETNLDMDNHDVNNVGSLKFKNGDNTEDKKSTIKTDEKGQLLLQAKNGNVEIGGSLSFANLDATDGSECVTEQEDHLVFSKTDKKLLVCKRHLVNNNVINRWEPVNSDGQYSYKLITLKQKEGRGAIARWTHQGDKPQMVSVIFTIPEGQHQEIDNCFVNVHPFLRSDSSVLLSRGYGISFAKKYSNEPQCLATTAFLALPSIEYIFSGLPDVDADITLFVPTTKNN